MIILDSNILIYSAQNEYAFLRELIFDDNCYVSQISKLEVLGFYRLRDTDRNYFESCFQLISLIDIDEEIIDQAIKLRQQRKFSVGDAIIAATALKYDATLYTRNRADFIAITGLNVTNPVD